MIGNFELIVIYSHIKQIMYLSLDVGMLTKSIQANRGPTKYSSIMLSME